MNITKDGRKIFGFFHNGKVLCGKSLMYYNEPDINQMHFTNIFEGEYRNNKREGYGKMIMANGDSYEGEFHNDSYCGKGIYIWANGNKYEGGFKNDKKEGKGKFTFANGGTIECLWKNDNPFVVD